MAKSHLSLTSVKLDCPGLEEVARTLQASLQKAFDYVEVKVVECPDLRKGPFNLASNGLGGTTAILDIGGPPYLLPLYDKEKVYNTKQIMDLIGMKPCFAIGAGAGPWPYVGKNSEMMANIFVNDSVVQNTHIAKLSDQTEDVILEVLPKSEIRFALMANLFACEGTSSQVLKIICKKRKISDNFITAIRLALDEAFPNKTIGLGGVFLLKEGKTKLHVMRDFSKTPLNTEKDLNGWLKFYDASSPLVAVGTLLSKQIPDLDLRIQHFHCFSAHGEGGHYHYDVSPETVEYEGYFNLGQTLYRIDQPVNTLLFGKD